MRFPLIVLLAALGCGGGGGKSPDGGGVAPDGGGDATADVGGNGGDGPATGGSTVTGGSGGGGSPGSATLRLELAPGTAYCDQATTCASIRHIEIRTASGAPLLASVGPCPL